MREIKFRGKGGITDSWLIGSLVTWKDGAMIYGGFLNEGVVRSETVGQYTGLKDKNSKEIYEGDIVKFNYTSKNYKGSSSIPYKVTCVCVYDESSGRFIYKRLSSNSKKLSRNWMSKGVGSFEIDNVEIIGNIHDNPELIKEEEK